MQTTIALPLSVKQEIMQFGNKGESYSEIILKLIKSAKQRQLQDLLMDEKDTIPVKDALKKAKSKWRG